LAARNGGQSGFSIFEGANLSVYDDHREELEKHEFMMGVPRGRLAITLDILTDALVLVGQHGVYCQSARQPGKPAMDIQMITRSISDAKELISSVLEELKRSSGPSEARQ
jgi:hypothetical protein